MKDLSEKLKRASSWLNGRKWKLDDTRSMADAGYQELTLTLTRVDDACPRDMLSAVVRQIEADETGVAQTALEVEGAVFEGTWYLKRVDCKRRDDGRNPPQDNELLLFKTYVRVTDKNPEAHIMENNCSYIVTHEFRYNMAELETVPAGSSGITYAIRAAGQDKETRLWDYLVEKREQLTTTTGVIVIEDDAFKTVYQQAFYGVRVGNNTHTGAAVALWDAQTQPQGTTVAHPFVQKNDNCTTDIIQRKTVAKAVANAKRSVEQDAYDLTQEQTDSNQPTAVIDSVVAAGGKVTRRWSETNNDRTYENRERIDQEISVVGAKRTVRQDAFEVVLENEDRNLALPANEDEVAPDGETLQIENEKTRGGWWRVVRRRVRAVFVPDAVVSYTRDAFQDVIESEQRAANNQLGAPPVAGGGIWRTWRDKLRPDRKYDQNKIETRERTLETAAREISNDAFEKHSTTESVSAAAADAKSVPVNGSIKSELTRGGYWRNSFRNIIENLLPLAGRESYRDTFEHRQTTESVGATPLDEVSEHSPGTTSANKSELTRGGLWRNREVIVTENDVEKKYISSKDYFASSEVTTGVADSVDLTIGVGESGRVSASMTPGGKLRYSKEIETPKSAMSWVLVNKITHTALTSVSGGAVSEHIKVVLYANSELATAQAEVSSFIGIYHSFSNTLGLTQYDFQYGHDVGFGLHVNKNGKWDGTLTMRARLEFGFTYTTVTSED